MIGKRVYFEENNKCTFGVLSQVWDNGYVKIAYIKVPKYTVISDAGISKGREIQLDFICATFEEINICEKKW